MDNQSHVLVVDDEADLADLYASWLSAKHTVETAHSGSEAIENVHDSIDVVLLDRRMPGLSGNAVLEEIRERHPECPVAMITAVDPDFDILEMGFDAYVTKPISAEELTTVVDCLLRRSEYTETLQEFFAKLSKRETLSSQKPQFELESNEQYRKLEEDIERLRKQSEEHITELDDEDFEALFHRLDA
ncbi:response regulator [Halobellus marinus]|uniref:response regulator n=1 Tax=Halobellus TaxID=1073986 RepID=UPI0028AE4F55|nr:response regulator [Halobellus sp. DFY28]